MLKICGSCACARKAEPSQTSATTHECRANPPTIDARNGEAEWPRVVSADWCGAWRSER